MNNIILPGTEVKARTGSMGGRVTQELGGQTLFRLRGLENAVLGKEFDLLSPFEESARSSTRFARNGPLPLANWLVYHQAFLLEQALGPNALLAVQPGRLENRTPTSSFRCSGLCVAAACGSCWLMRSAWARPFRPGSCSPS